MFVLFWILYRFLQDISSSTSRRYLYTTLACQFLSAPALRQRQCQGSQVTPLPVSVTRRVHYRHAPQRRVDSHHNRRHLCCKPASRHRLQDYRKKRAEMKRADFCGGDLRVSGSLFAHCQTSFGLSRPIFQSDLDQALSGEFGFKGDCYYTETSLTAPNPALTVEGIGPIGLPLPERDAKLIISKASLPKCGEDKQMLANSKVQNTWEIEPTSVGFRNPNWQQYVDGMAFKTVFSALGIASSIPKPRCELSRLLLCEPGSQ